MINSSNSQQGSTLIGSTQWDSSWPELSGEGDRDYLFRYLEKRFGIPQSLFDDYLLFRKGKNWWLFRRTPLIAKTAQLKVWRVGLKAFQGVGRFIKPTTRMIQLFGHTAKKALIPLTETDLEHLIKGEQIRVKSELSNGYVILSFKKEILGLGLFIDGGVISQMPKKDMRLVSRGFSF
jgi:NOL1/NOP2/fmu family ribosome biogenesis protein